MTPSRLHDLGHRELFSHDFALLNPVRIPEDRWQDLPVVPLRAPVFAAQPHLVPRLLPLRALDDDCQVELLERNGRHCVETGQPLFCALLASRLDAQPVAGALGARMVVRTPAGQAAWLRFHDPRVFSALAWWLEPGQLRCMLGPVLSWSWFDPRDGQWQCIERPGADGRDTARLRLTAAQWARLGRLPAVNRCLKMLARDGVSPRPLRPLVERLDALLEQAAAAGLPEPDAPRLRQWMHAGIPHTEEHA